MLCHVLQSLCAALRSPLELMGKKCVDKKQNRINLEIREQLVSIAMVLAVGYRWSNVGGYVGIFSLKMAHHVKKTARNASES